jgi:hypothetical protein
LPDLPATNTDLHLVLGDDEILLALLAWQGVKELILSRPITTRIGTFISAIVRIQKITAEVVRWPNVETGGILIGGFSEIAQPFYITDILAAPEDSERSAHFSLLERTA